MMNLALDGYEMLHHPDKLLAVVGGAGVGGLALGLMVQVLVRGWTGKQLPRWSLMSLRGVGGIASGWLVALWMFAGGGGGMGGPGGFGFGTGTQSGSEQPVSTTRNKEEPAGKEDDFTKEVPTLYVEVLGEKTLRALDQSLSEPLHCYRIETPKGARLLTRKEVDDYLKQRITEKPPLKALTIVLYDDSPSRYVQRVVDLKEDAEGLTLTVAIDRRKQNAPLKSAEAVSP